MRTNLTIPTFEQHPGNVTLLRWIRNDGDFVNHGDSVAELESSKARFELAASASGTLQHGKPNGYVGGIGEIVGWIEKSELSDKARALNDNVPLPAPALPYADPYVIAAEKLQSHLPKFRGWDRVFLGTLVPTVWLVFMFSTAAPNDWHIILHLFNMAMVSIFFLRNGTRTWRLAKSLRWILDGCCAKCGYDLQGSVDRCPECGRLIISGPTPLSDEYAYLYHHVLLPEAEAAVQR